MLASQVTVPAPWRRSRQDRRRRQGLRGEVAAAQQLRGYIGAISYSRSREIDGAQPSKASSPVVTGNVTGVGGNPAAYIVSLNLKRRHLDERQRALVAAKIANMRSSTRTDLEPPANLPQESCELDHVLHPDDGVRSCPPYSTSSTANTAVPASPKCENSFFWSRLRATRSQRIAMSAILAAPRVGIAVLATIGQPHSTKLAIFTDPAWLLAVGAGPTLDWAEARLRSSQSSGQWWIRCASGESTEV